MTANRKPADARRKGRPGPEPITRSRPRIRQERNRRGRLTSCATATAKFGPECRSSKPPVGGRRGHCGSSTAGASKGSGDFAPAVPGFYSNQLALGLSGSLVQPSGELPGWQQHRSPDCLACGRRLARAAAALSSREPEPRPRGASPQAAHLLTEYFDPATRRHDADGLGPIADSTAGWHVVRSVIVVLVRQSLLAPSDVRPSP